MTFDEMRVDHVIPRSLAGDALREALRLHGLSSSYSLDAVQNLVPACDRCNGVKGDRPLPTTPVISLFLEKTQRLEPQISAAAATFHSDRRVARAFGTLRAALADRGIDQSVLDDVAAGLTETRDAIEVAAPGTNVINLDPAARFVLQPGVWKIVGPLSSVSDEVVTVVDGRGRGGYTGTSSNFACPFCGHHGPWNGTRCMTCGQMSDPFD